MIRRLLRRLGQWLVAKTERPEEDGIIIDLGKAYEGYVSRYAKHAKYGDTEAIRVGVNSSVRAYDHATAMDNRRYQKAEQ